MMQRTVTWIYQPNVYTFGRRLTTTKKNKLIINQDVLLRTPIAQVRRHMDDLK
jgi:hypothetical protein